MAGRFALAAVAGQATFMVSWIIAGRLEPRYSAEEEAVSALAAGTAEHPWIVTAGVLAWAVGTACCAEALRRGVRLRRLRRLPVALLWIAAAGMVALALAPLDCSPVGGSQCLRLQRAGELSSRHYAHELIAGIPQITVGTSPFALWLSLRPGRGARAALASGIAGLLLTWWVGTALELNPGDRGAGQRILLGAFVLWLCAVAVTAWRQSRPSSRG